MKRFSFFRCRFFLRGVNEGRDEWARKKMDSSDALTSGFDVKFVSWAGTPHFLGGDKTVS